MNFCALSSRSIDRRVDRHVRMRGLDGGDAFRRGDDAEQPDVARAGLLQQRRWPRSRCRRWPASDRRRARCCCERSRGSFDVVARGDRRLLVALQADVADARVGQQLEHRVDHAQAGAQHRHDDDVGVERLALAPARAASRRAPSVIGSLRVASVATHQAEPMGQPPEVTRRASSGRAATSGHPARSDAAPDGRGTWRTIHAYRRVESGAMRIVARFCWWSPSLLVAVIACCWSRPSRPVGRRASSLLVTGGTVVTMDADRRGDPRRRRRHRRRPDRRRRVRATTSTASIAPRRRIDARGQIVLPGLDQHAHPRADGAVPRPGRRPGADGLAARSTSSRPRRRRSRRTSCASARAWPRSR